MSFSQNSNSDSSKVIKLIKHGLIDSRELIKSPLGWNKKDSWIASGAIAATGLSIMYIDQPVYDFVNQHHSENCDRFFMAVEPMGHSYPLLLAGGFAVHGLITQNNYSLETGIIAVESFVLASLFTHAVKITAGRQRPNDWGTTSPHHWEGPFLNGTSFASGHTTAAFASASVFAYRYRHKKWVPIVAYSLATLGGMQRIYKNRHWTSDVIMGAAIGTATGIFLAKQWEHRPLNLFPIIGDETIGMTIIITL